MQFWPVAATFQIKGNSLTIFNSIIKKAPRPFLFDPSKQVNPLTEMVFFGMCARSLAVIRPPQQQITGDTMT
jgi:hypothetical protein